MQNDNNFQPEAIPRTVPQESVPQGGQPPYPPTSAQIGNQMYATPPQRPSGIPGRSSGSPVSLSFIAYILIALASVGYAGSIFTGFYYASWIFSEESVGLEIALIVGVLLLALVGLVMVVMQARKKIAVSHILAMIVAVFIAFSSLNTLASFIVYQVSSDAFDSQTTEVSDDELDLSDPTLEQ